jgi:hypothetical protein
MSEHESTPEESATGSTEAGGAEPDELAKLRRENAARRKRERELEAENETLRVHVGKQDSQALQSLAGELGFRQTADAMLFLGDRSHLAGEDGFLDLDKAREALGGGRGRASLPGRGTRARTGSGSPLPGCTPGCAAVARATEALVRLDAEGPLAFRPGCAVRSPRRQARHPIRS